MEFCHPSGPAKRGLTIGRRSVAGTAVSRGVELVLLCAALLCASTSRAELPVARLNQIFPAGGQQGASAKIAVTGPDLDELKEMRFSAPEITARLEGGQFQVAISSNVLPGFYETRVLGRFGLSNPRIFHVSPFPEHFDKGDNRQRDKAQKLPVPAAVNGKAERNAFTYYEFSASKGDRLFVEALAERLDSKMVPTLVLQDSQGKELARSKGEYTLDVSFTNDTLCILRINDHLFNGGDEYFYRLLIHKGPIIDLAAPSMITLGQTNRVQAIGRALPGGSPSPFKHRGIPLEQLDLEIPGTMPPEKNGAALVGLLPPWAAWLDGFAFHFHPQAQPVFMRSARHPIAVEDLKQNDKPPEARKIQVPCEIAGTFYPKSDRDWYEFEARKGQVYWLEVWSHRLGQPTDPFLLAQKVNRNDQGVEQLADVVEMYDLDAGWSGVDFKLSSRDPVARFEAKEDGVYRVLVTDLFNRSQDDAKLIYHLAIRPETPDFSLVALPQPPPEPNKDKREVLLWNTVLPAGTSAPFRVLALRQDGFDGAIDLEAAGLPAFISATGRIEPGAKTGALLFTASSNAAPWAGEVHITGKATIHGKEHRRLAKGGLAKWTVPDYNNEAVASRLTHTVAISTTGELAPVTIQSAIAQPFATNATAKITIPLVIQRRGEFNGKLKLKPAGFPALDPLKEVETPDNTTNFNYEINLADLKLAPGQYSFFFVSQTQGKYQRLRPEAFKLAEQEIKTLETEAGKTAQAVTDSSNAAKKAAEDLDKATKEFAALELKLKGAKEAADAKKKQLSTGNADDATKAALAELEKELPELEKKAQALTAAKQQSEKGSAEAAQKQKTAEAARDETARKLKAAKDRVQTQTITLTSYSDPIQLKITGQ